MTVLPSTQLGPGLGVTSLVLLLVTIGFRGNDYLPPSPVPGSVDPHFDNCWATVGATGIADDGSAHEQIELGDLFVSQLTTTTAPTAPAAATDINTVQTFGGVAYLANAPRGSYKLRFPVSQQFIFSAGNQIGPIPWDVVFRARYKVADPARFRVRVELKRYSMNRPPRFEAVQTIAVLDSEGQADATDFRVMSANFRDVVFDFNNFAYFVEAQLVVKRGSFATTPRGSIDVALGQVSICVDTSIE